MGNSNSPSDAILDQQCDRCVKCGMCLTVCPTYRLAGQETESPRGRITMIQALVRQELSLSPQVISHLDNCLQCRACEAICPSGVPYGDIIEQGQMLMRGKKSRNVTTKSFWHLFNRLLQPRRRLITLPRLLWLVQLSGLVRFMARSRIAVSAGLAQASRRLSKVSRTAKTDLARGQAVSGRKVVLFPGCMGHVLQEDVIHDAVRVLQRIGFSVELSAAGHCCGALHAREGEHDKAQELLESSMNSLPPDHTAVALVSACTARLRANQDRSAAVEDFTTFLSRHWPGDIKLRPLAKTVIVHEACSLRNILKEQKHLYQLLRAIPDAQIVALPDNAICCGAAGTHALSHPVQAGRMLQPKLDRLHELRGDILVTTNLGCAMHFQGGLAATSQTQVMHPARLLASLL